MFCCTVAACPLPLHIFVQYENISSPIHIICSSRGLGASPLGAWWRLRAGQQQGDIAQRRDSSAAIAVNSAASAVGRAQSDISAATAVSCAAVRRADGRDPRPIGVHRFCFVFCASFLLFSQALFSFVGWWPVFFGELYRCSTVSWPVYLSLGLSTGG